MAEGEDSRLKWIKSMIRSVVMSVKEGVPATRFAHDYLELSGEPVPYKLLGYSSLDSFIRSMPDVVHVRTIQGVETYFAVADKTTQHLQNLIQRQKSNPKKSKALKRGPSPRFPKYHSQLSRTPPFGGGGYRSGPEKRLLSSQVKGFGRQRPILGATPIQVKSPILPMPVRFSSSNLSPLMVTISNRAGEKENERVIERRGGGNGARQIAARAIKDVMGQRQQDKKSSVKNALLLQNNRYEVPPRFQKLLNVGKNIDDANAPNTGTTGRPVAVVPPSQHNQTGEKVEDSMSPSVPETSLLSNIKSWTAKLVKNYTSGLWFSRFKYLYTEEFGQDPPSNLLEIVETWVDIVHVELNSVAKRYVLYPAPDNTVSETTASSSPHHPEMTENLTPSPEKPSSKQWQNFNVPLANLFEVGEMTEVYASFSNDLSDFYLQRVDSCVEDITVMLDNVQEDVAVPRASDLQAGVFCAALYSEDKNWYRARVLYMLSNTEVHVIFIDYGNVEMVSINDIRCLTEETASIPAQAISCVMFALKPFDGENGWSEKAKETFHSLMDGKDLSCQTCQIQEGYCVVELWIKDSEMSVNEQLYNEGLVDTYLPRNVDPSDLELPQDGYIEVVVAFVDLKHCWLRLIGKEYSETLEAFEDKLSLLYKEAEGQPKRILEDSICIAQCDLLYHRVKIREIKDHQANCFFVDHGYTEWFPLDQLAPLDKDINQSLPYQAVWCVLVGLDKYMSNPVTITELVERSKNKICVAEVIYRDPLKVMLYDTHGNDDININEEIAKKLVAEGHVIDMSLFSALSDNASEGSRASSPSTAPNSTVMHVETDVHQLQSATQTLTLGDSSMNKDSVISQNVKTDVEVNARSPEQSVQPTTTANATAVIPPQETVQDCNNVPVSVGSVSPAAVSTNVYSDSLCVAYNTWPLPSSVPMPDYGMFFAVYVQSVIDPANFVIVPHNMLSSLEDMMMQMNTDFNSILLQEGSSQSQTPTNVPVPQPNHLYMAMFKKAFYRAIYLNTTDTLLHVFLPDYCHHVLISPDEMFFLPKKYWSMPFAAFRASLFGVRPAGGNSEKLWSESVKYRFTEQIQSKTLMAAIKKVEATGDHGTSGQANDRGVQTLQTWKQKLLLHLVDTSDPDTDVVISEELLATCKGVVADL